MTSNLFNIGCAAALSIVFSGNTFATLPDPTPSDMRTFGRCVVLGQSASSVRGKLSDDWNQFSTQMIMLPMLVRPAPIQNEDFLAGREEMKKLLEGQPVEPDSPVYAKAYEVCSSWGQAYFKDLWISSQKKESLPFNAIKKGTLANVKLIRDAKVGVAQKIATMGCNAPEGVEPYVIAMPVGTAGARRWIEMWEVTGCGRKFSVRIVFSESGIGAADWTIE